VTAFVVKRLAQAVPTVFLSTLAVFLLLHLLPGDPAVVLAGPEATPQTVDAIREELGLNRPLPVQYVDWLGRVAQGDLGRSATSKLPVAQLISQRAPATLELAMAAELLTIVLALPLGIVWASKQRTRTDWGISSAVSFGLAVPNFWLGIVLVMVFAIGLGWLPPAGRGDWARDPLTELKFLILPTVTLAVPAALYLSRLTRASVLEVLYEDFVRTARAKGLTRSGVLRQHVVRNALVPTVTAIGLEFGRLLGGAVIVESVFAWPGLGTLIVQSIGNRDYATVQAALLLLVLVFIVVNTFTDIAYGFLDPRIRFASGR
jgi:peptide/nickel transport system permease protein